MGKCEESLGKVWEKHGKVRWECGKRSVGSAVKERSESVARALKERWHCGIRAKRERCKSVGSAEKVLPLGKSLVSPSFISLRVFATVANAFHQVRETLEETGKRLGTSGRTWEEPVKRWEPKSWERLRKQLG